ATAPEDYRDSVNIAWTQRSSDWTSAQERAEQARLVRVQQDLIQKSNALPNTASDADLDALGREITQQLAVDLKLQAVARGSLDQKRKLIEDDRETLRREALAQAAREKEARRKAGVEAAQRKAAQEELGRT